MRSRSTNMDTTMTGETVVVCRGCDREIEACIVCDAEDCTEAECYRCVTVELGEARREPHDHGG